MIRIALLCAPNIIHSNITALVPKLYNTNYFLIDKTPLSGLDNIISRFCFHILKKSLASSILPPHVSTSTKVNYEKDFFCDVFDSQKMHIYFLVSSFLGQQYGLQQAWIHVILPLCASILLCRTSNLNWGKNLIQSGILKNWIST